MVQLEVEMQFGKRGYIAQPFWQEMKRVIAIQKNSGYNRVKQEKRRKQVLMAELERQGMSEKQYEDLLEASKRPFYTCNGEIVIPAEKIYAFINNSAQLAPKHIPTLDRGLIFVALDIQEPGIRTGKTAPDGVFSRFVKLEESNERALSESAYISDFTGSFKATLKEEIYSPKDLKILLEWGGRMVGIGAARPQGYGRFEVTKFSVAAATATGR